MLYVNVRPCLKDMFYLFHKLRKNGSTCQITKERMEENFIAAIYDNDILCGGALLFGRDAPVYMLCFFEKREYCTEEYLGQLRTGIESVIPEIKSYDVFCLNDGLCHELLFFERSDQRKTEQQKSLPGYQVSARKLFSDLLLKYIYQWAKKGILFDYKYTYSDLLIEIYPPYITYAMEYISSTILDCINRESVMRIKTEVRQDHYYLKLLFCAEGKEEEGDTIQGRFLHLDVMMRKMEAVFRVERIGVWYSIIIGFPNVSNNLTERRGLDERRDS